MESTNRAIVFFCDDMPADGGENQRKPFWHGRPEWEDASWAEWEVFRIPQPDGRGSMVPRFIAAIKAAKPSGEIFVVTDAYFGSAATDGAALLKELNERLVRGVVFSVTPELLAEQELSEKLWRVVDNRSGREASTIRKFLKDGTKGGSDGVRDRNLLLSRAIHAIENLAVPIRMDIGTLSDPSLLDEIFSENLGAAGYLATERVFSHGSGIEAEIAHYLGPIAGLKLTALERFLVDGEVDREKVEVELQIVAAREDGNAMTTAGTSIDRVRSALEGVAKALTDLADALRQVRDAKESRQEEAQ